MNHRPSRTTLLFLVLVGLSPASLQAQDLGKAAPAADPQERPPAIAEVKLGPTLPTIPVPRRPPGPNWYVVDSSPLPKDREGVWVLDFAFKPMRMIEIEIPGKGRRKIHYLYYKVVNRTGKPQMFVPQFTLVTDRGQRYEDTAGLAQAVKLIQAREGATIPLLGAVSTTGILPPSTKEGVDDVLFGVAIWDNVDFKADAFKVYVRGLSDAYQVVTPPDGGKPYTRYKALRIDFQRPGDEFSPNEREIRLMDPPYEWVYYP